MSFFKRILILLIFFSFSAVKADNHDKKSDLVEQAKEITANLEKNTLDDEDVPLNDPFAGNEGTSGNAASIDLETGAERD